MTFFDLARIGSGLPVAETIDELPHLLESSATLVIQAPPGTGKTTLVPPALANFLASHPGLDNPGKVIITAPRRVAVRAAAKRLAYLDGSRLGERVGYSIKGEHKPGSLVEFVTPGVLLRRLLKDPELAGVSAVAIDEVHERQLDSDLILGMLIELTQLRDDFYLAAMSATLDAAKFAGLLGAPILETPAVTHPLTVTYSPHNGRAGCTREFLQHLADLALAATQAHAPHSTLVFVPGVREVDAVIGCLNRSPYPVLPLHGSLTSKEQDAALAPVREQGEEVPRIIVATSIAESSLTVPGVRTVIDSGLSRVPRRDSQRGMTGLVTISAAQSTVDQRAGRAGREGLGTVIRAYSQADYQHAAAHITPEIATSDLTQAALWLACWGSPDLPLPDQPPAAALQAARETLATLRAIDESRAPTPLGRRLATLPMDPRLGRALLECGPQAAPTIAVLADQPTGDIARQRAPQREVARLRRLIDAEEHNRNGATDPGVITGMAYPLRVAKRQGEDYLLASGTRAWLPPDSGLAGADWLAIAEVTRARSGAGRSGAVIRAAARITEADALEIIGVTETTEATFEGGKLRGRTVRRAGKIELSSAPTQLSAAEAAPAIASAIRTHGLGLFTFSEKAQGLMERMRFLHKQLGDPWPDPVKADPEFWLGPELDALAHGTAPSRLDMYPALQRLLPWPEAARLDELAPANLAVPSGSHPRISYAEGRPVTRVKLQECFGLAQSPECAGVKVLFHLLSPAGRPLAVTDDLTSFWSGPYAQVRAEMRGRYPKHPWPEDPWSAPATARTKKRM